MRSLLCGAVLAGSWMTPARAEPLSADAAVTRALRVNPVVEALRHQLTAERAEIEQAGELSNPQLRVGSLRSDTLLMPLIDDGDYRSPLDGLSLDLRWKPPNPGVRDAERASARRRVDQAHAQLVAAQEELAADVRESHATVLNLADRAALARDALAAWTSLRDLLSRRLAAGEATALQLNSVELRRLDAETDLVDLETEQREAYGLLRLALEFDPAVVLDLVPDERKCAPPQGTTDELVAQAIAASPALAEFDARRAEYGDEVTRLEWERVPWLDFIEVGYKFAEGSDPLRMTNPAVCQGQCDDPATIRLSFGVTLPILDRNHPELRVLDALGQRVDAEARAARTEIERDVRQAADELFRRATLYERYVAAETDVVADTEAKITASAAAGVADPLELISAQRQVWSMREARLETRLKCRIAAIKLDRRLGRSSRVESGHTPP